MNKVKRIAAIIGIILIFSMYVISFITAIFARKYAEGLFVASIFCTIAIPIMIYLFMMVYKMVHKKDNPEEFEDTKADDQ